MRTTECLTELVEYWYEYDTERVKNYLNQGESPAVYGGRESDTPQHKPRSTLIQGYPL